MLKSQSTNSKLLAMKVQLDNEKRNRSYDLKIRTIEDMEVLIAQMKKNRDYRYRNRSDFVDAAMNQLINKLWKEVFNETRST